MGTPGSAHQGHARLGKQPVALPHVAGDAGDDAVAPGRATTAAARHDVVDAEFLGGAAASAVLAAIAIAAVEVATGEWDAARRHLVVAQEPGQAFGVIQGLVVGVRGLLVGCAQSLCSLVVFDDVLDFDHGGVLPIRCGIAPSTDGVDGGLFKSWVLKPINARTILWADGGETLCPDLSSFVRYSFLFSRCP